MIFQKCCGNCKFHERLINGPKDMYFRCKSKARIVHLKRDRVKDRLFFNAVLCTKLSEKTECPFWEQKNESHTGECETRPQQRSLSHLALLKPGKDKQGVGRSPLDLPDLTPILYGKTIKK